MRSLHPPLRRARSHYSRGIALLEALIATTILAIGLLGAIGMQARAYSALSDASMRAEATIASEKLLAQMTIDQSNLASYAYAGSGTANARLTGWITETRAAIPAASIKVVVAPVAGTSRSQVDIAIGWQRKQGSIRNVHAVTSYIANSR
jgi:type IV pilus assembly protein PilV